MKKICFIINSAGGLSVIYPILEKILKKKIKAILLYSAQVSKHKLIKKVKIKKFFFKKNISLKSSSSILRSIQPDLVICSNNGNNKFETNFLRSSKLNKINSFTIMDSWSYPLRRFQYKIGSKTFEIFPNTIGVPNKKIYNLIKNKAKFSDVFISGYPQINYNIENYYKHKKIKKNKKFVEFLYISTPYEKKKVNHISDGSEIYFNQENILKIFLDTIHKFTHMYDLKVNLTMRLHPLDKLRFQEFKKKNKNYKNIVIKINKKIFNYESYLNKDAVFGISSMMLYEASLCGLPSISLQLSKEFKKFGKTNYFKNIKGIKVCSEKNDLFNQLENIVKRKNLKTSESIKNKFISKRNNNLIFDKLLKGLN